MHILWEAAAEQIPEPNIPTERVKAAKGLADFYLGQVQLIYSDGEASQGELNPILIQILVKAKQLGEISARTAKQGIKALKKTPSQQVREYLNELAVMGYGDLEGQGNRIKFIPKTVDQTVDRTGVAKKLENSTIILSETKNCRPSVDLKKSPQTIGKRELQPDSDSKCRPVDQFLELTDSPVMEPQSVDVQGEIEAEDLTNDSLQGQQVYSWLESLDKSRIETVDQGSTLGSTMPFDESLKVGDRVIWDTCPCCYEWASPFKIVSIEGDRALLELYEKPVPISELKRERNA